MPSNINHATNQNIQLALCGCFELLELSEIMVILYDIEKGKLCCRQKRRDYAIIWRLTITLSIQQQAHLLVLILSFIFSNLISVTNKQIINISNVFEGLAASQPHQPINVISEIDP